MKTGENGETLKSAKYLRTSTLTANEMKLSEFESTILNSYKVSFFDSVSDKNPKEFSMLQFYNAIKSGIYRAEIEAVREAKEKSKKDELKKHSLPAITTSGSFSSGRTEKCLLKHSGLLQIDLDSVENLEATKQMLCADQYTFIGFISPSGQGLKLVIKINSTKHMESFNQLREYYHRKYNLRIDEKCKDLPRLMFVSYDEDIYLNSEAIEFAIKEAPMNSGNKGQIFANKNVSQDVEEIILQVEASQADITLNYDNWLKIGFAFTDEFGELGRSLFHRISLFNSNYNKVDCNRQYDKCLKEGKNGITIKTFFYLAKEFGFNIKKQAISENNSSLNNKTTNENSKFQIVKKYINDRYDLRYNVVANQIETKSKHEEKYTILNEDNLYVELQSDSVFVSQSNLSALMRSDFVPKYDPLREYFEKLPEWDGITDHIGNLCKYLNVKDQDRFEIQFRKMLIRSIACSLDGVFNKHAFILIGGQSSGKTTFTRWICPKNLAEYMAENINTDKDGLIALSENFIIVLDELATLHKSELNALKSYFTKDQIKVRRPFDKKATRSPRRANFLGSTNKVEFLTDETGSVRWICFQVERIDFNYSSDIDINDIWAHAHSLYKSGYNGQLTPDELKENETMNNNHQSLTSEIELIQKHFEAGSKESHDNFLTASELMIILNKEYPGLTKLNIIGIGKALAFLKFEKVNLRKNNSEYPVKGYYVNIITQFNSSLVTTSSI
jgi:hypothetical protein